MYFIPCRGWSISSLNWFRPSVDARPLLVPHCGAPFGALGHFSFSAPIWGTDSDEDLEKEMVKNNVLFQNTIVLAHV